ncbi:unnamed protein product, partial [Prorocentrum cordatum]
VALEGRAMVLAHLHKTRSLANFGKGHLFLGDAKASILAVSKGRSPSKLMRICRQIAGLNLACGMTFHWRWLPSEHNPADRGSRRKAGDWAEASLRHREPEEPSCHAPAPRHAPVGGDSCGHRDRRVRAFAARLGRARGAEVSSALGGFALADTGADASEDLPEASCELPGPPAPRGRPPRREGRPPSEGQEPTFDENGLTLLERRTVQRPQEARYKHSVTMFTQWCLTEGLPTHATCQLDQVVVAYFTDHFFAGMSSSAGSFLLAALTYCQRGLSAMAPELPRARRALAGFLKVTPNRSRWPLPWPLAALIAVKLCEMEQWRSAAATLLCFVFYTRPSEILRLRVKDAVPRALQPLLDLRYAIWAAQFSQAAVDVGLGALGPPPALHQLRHGGAGQELAERARPLAEIKKRGRWAADSSGRRYEKSGPLPTQLQRASADAQRKAHAAASSIGSRILKLPS